MCGRYYVDDETAEENRKSNPLGEIRTIKQLQIHSQERKNYAGIPSIEFDCTIVILGGQLAAKLIYYMSEGRWVLNFK